MLAKRHSICAHSAVSLRSASYAMRITTASLTCYADGGTEMQKPSKLSLTVAVFLIGSETVVGAAGLKDKGGAEGLNYAIIIEKPAYFYDDNGKITGSDVETLTKALAGMGIEKVNPMVVEWSSIVPGVKSKRYDVGAAMYITPERCKEVAFSEPYDIVIPTLVVRKGNPDKITGWVDFKNQPGFKVGIYAGGAEYKYMIRVGVPAERILSLPDQNSLIQALLNGQIQAFNTGVDQALQLQNTVPEIEIAAGFVAPEWSYSYVSWPFAKDNAGFVSELNVQIKKLLESGELQKIKEKFGEVSDTRKYLGATAAEICAR